MNSDLPNEEGDWLDKHDKFINDFSREGREIKKEIQDARIRPQSKLIELWRQK